MGYKVIDFRDLVTLWYNEFLPERVGDRSVFVEDANILYLKHISIDKHLRRDTIKFLERKALELAGSDIGWVVQEPKPVNNIEIQPLLKYLEGMKDMSIERRDKVLHFANRRYVPLSSNILVSQDKELDDFLDEAFKGLADARPANIRPYAMQSMGVQDFIGAAKALLPRKSLSIQAEIQGEHIQVRSTNEMLGQLKSYAINGISSDSANLEFIVKCRESLGRDIEGLL